MNKYEKTVLDNKDSKEDIYFEKLLKCFNHNKILLKENGILQSEIDEYKYKIDLKEREFLAIKAKYNMKKEKLTKVITKECNKEIMRLLYANKQLRRRSKFISNLNEKLEKEKTTLRNKNESLSEHIKLHTKAKIYY